MKRNLIMAFATVALISSLTACTNKDSQTPLASITTEENTSAGETEVEGAKETGTGEQLKIGILQLTQHVALDATYDGFVEGLKEEGFVDGENIKIDFNNANNDLSNCVTIASKLVNDKSDLILAIATPAAQAVAGKTTEIPTVITAVTDPFTSELVDSNEVPGGNITGSSDLNPVAEQIKLLTQLVPEAKKVAILYNSSETNSEFQAELARVELKKAGLESINATVSSTNELQSVVQSLVGKVDAIYAPTDNLIAEGMSAVASIANENKIPCIVGEEGMVTNGALATYGINYFNLGKQTGVMAAKILKGESQPATMPIEYLKDATLVINTTVAKELGIEIPKELLEKATIVE